MVFVESRFILFFAAVFVVYWLIPANRDRKLWLLAASYLFYGIWDWRFLMLLIASSSVDYFAALYIDRTSNALRRKAVFWSAICFNLGVLGFFKYFNFFAGSFADFAGMFGFTPGFVTLNIVLPVGISFYTFQTMSYTIDVYRREQKPTTSMLDFALFVAFFPQLVAGPIVRARELLEQFASPRAFPLDARNAVLLCVVGFFKKAVVADNIAAVIDPVWSTPHSYDWLSVIAVQPLFAVQVYCDFSGYSDIAIGTAALLGFHMPRNFGPALLARNMSELWRLWHITLGSWFRDYVFTRIVKRKRDPWAIAGGLFVTMALIGLWHGADWTFVIWGMLQGTALAYLALRRFSKSRSRLPRMPYLIAWALTIGFFSFTGVLFRAPDIHAAIDVYRIDLTGSTGTATITLIPYFLLGVLGLVHWAWHRYQMETRLSTFPGNWFALATGTAFAISFSLAPREVLPFIYFQF